MYPRHVAGEGRPAGGRHPDVGRASVPNLRMPRGPRHEPSASGRRPSRDGHRTPALLVRRSPGCRTPGWQRQWPAGPDHSRVHRSAARPMRTGRRLRRRGCSGRLSFATSEPPRQYLAVLSRQTLGRFLCRQPPSREGDFWSHDSCDSFWLATVSRHRPPGRGCRGATPGGADTGRRASFPSAPACQRIRWSYEWRGQPAGSGEPPWAGTVAYWPSRADAAPCDGTQKVTAAVIHRVRLETRNLTLSLITCTGSGRCSWRLP